MSLEALQNEVITIADPQWENGSIADYVNPGRYLACVDPANATSTVETDQEGQITTWEIVSGLLDLDTGVTRADVRKDARITLPTGAYARVMTAQRFAAVGAIPAYWFITAESCEQTG